MCSFYLLRVPVPVTKFCVSVASLFEDRWIIGNERPGSSFRIGRIFEIDYPSSVKMDQSNYMSVHWYWLYFINSYSKSFCGTSKKLENSGLRPRQEYSFFSSQCICNFGAHLQQKEALCNFGSCGICMALKSSFRYFAFGTSQMDGR